MKHRKIKLPNGEWAIVVFTGEETEVFIVWSNGKVTTGQHDSGYENLCETVADGMTHDQCYGLVPPGPETVLYAGAKPWGKNPPPQ